MEVLNIVLAFLTLLYLRDAPREMKVPGSHGNVLLEDSQRSRKGLHGGGH